MTVPWEELPFDIKLVTDSPYHKVTSEQRLEGCGANQTAVWERCFRQKLAKYIGPQLALLGFFNSSCGEAMRGKVQVVMGSHNMEMHGSVGGLWLLVCLQLRHSQRVLNSTIYFHFSKDESGLQPGKTERSGGKMESGRHTHQISLPGELRMLAWVRVIAVKREGDKSHLFQINFEGSIDEICLEKINCWVNL